MKLPNEPRGPNQLLLDRPHAGCAAQSCGQEIPVQVLFGSISKTASLCRKEMCHWATILDPAIHLEKALWAQVWGGSGKQPAWSWPGLRPFFLPWQVPESCSLLLLFLSG